MLTLIFSGVVILTNAFSNNWAQHT